MRIPPEGTKPWLSNAGKHFVGLHMNNMSDWDILEIGSGASTIWYAKRCKSIIAIEHNKGWYGDVLLAIARAKAKNASVHFLLDITKEIADETFPGPFDFVIVDGSIDRVKTAKAVFHMVKPGGLFMLDDSQRHAYQEILDDLKEFGWEKLSTDWAIGCGQNADRTTDVWRRPNGS